VIPLSHVGLSVPPDDPLYGQRPPDNEDVLYQNASRAHYQT